MSSSSSSSQGVVLATAMALSGTVILLALRLHKSLPLTSSSPTLRSCISSEGKKKNKQKKRVHFAEDVVDSSGDRKDFRRKHRHLHHHSNSEFKVQEQEQRFNGGNEVRVRGMPANRVALYNGILRDRMAHRLAYSY